MGKLDPHDAWNQIGPILEAFKKIKGRLPFYEEEKSKHFCSNRR